MLNNGHTQGTSGNFGRNMKKYLIILPAILSVVGGAGFLLWAQIGVDRTDYPDAKEYAPSFWFDSEENYYPTSPLDFYYDENLNEVAGVEARQKYDNLSEDGKLENFKVYYNIDDSENELVYQYWLFYVFNDSTNEHYGDWESVFAFLDKKSGDINKIVASAHNGTETKAAFANNELSKPSINHIRILVEKGSHANAPDGNGDGLFSALNPIEKAKDITNWYNAYGIQTWSKTDKLHGLKVEHDSPHYDLRPIEEIQDVFGKKYDEDRPLITKEKSPSLGMVPFKIGKKRMHALPFGGDPPSNAWNKKQFVNSREVLPLTPTRFASKVGGFFNNTGSFLAAVGNAVAGPFAGLFGDNDTEFNDEVSELTADVEDTANLLGSDPAERGQTPVPTPASIPTPTPIPAAPTPAFVEPETELALVTRVIDGDTVELASGQKLRYIGINTPELPNGCFAQEATVKNSELVLNRQIILLQGPTDQDNFGRLLRFAWQDVNLSGTIDAPDIFINRTLIDGGYAYAFDFGEEHDYDHVFEAAESVAKRERLGLWGDACDPKEEEVILNQKPKPIVRMYEPSGSVAPTTNNDDVGDTPPSPPPPPADETPPDAPTSSIADNTFFNSSSDINSEEDGYQIIFWGTAEPLSLVTITQNPTYTATTTGEGDWSAEVSLINEGTNIFSITAKDAAGNTSTSTLITLNLDSIAPTSTIAVADYKIEETEFKINWSTDATDLDYYEVEYKIGNAGAWQDWGSATTTETDKDYKDATSNTYYFKVRGTDIHQNIGDWQESIGVVIDLTSRIVINEVQLADAEFVELYNAGSEQIDLDEGYYFSYYSSSKISWIDPWRNKAFPEDAKISAGGYFLIGLDGYPTTGGNPNVDWQVYTSKQLANSAGTIAIFPFDPTSASSSQYAYDNRIDAIGWGTAEDISLYEQSPATATPVAGESLTRDSNHTDTENNSADFTVATSTTPTNSAGETYVPPAETSPVWAMYQKDARHSGLATLSGPSWTNSSQATTTWVFDIAGAGGRSQPVVGGDGSVYAVNALGELYAIKSDGTQKWKFDPQDQGDGTGWSTSSPAISSDGEKIYTVYTRTDSAPQLLILYSIKTSDGSFDWKYPVVGGNESFTSPVLDSNDNIYVASKTKLYSISQGGSLNWSFAPYSNFSPSPMWIKMPAVNEESGTEYVYITSKITNNAGDRYIWKLKASDGSEVWKQNPTGNNALSNGVSINATGTIYTGGYVNIGTSGLFAVDPSDGSKIWSNNVGDSVGINIPSFDADGNIFLGTDHAGTSGALHKINATGTVMWSFSPHANPSAVQYPAVVDGQGRVYVGAKNKYVYALDADTGAIIWKYQLSDEPVGFAIGDGRVYVVGYEGKVYAFGE